MASEVPELVKSAPKSRISIYTYLDFYKLAKSEELIKRIDLVMDDKLLADKYTLTAIYTQMSAPLAKPIESIETPIMIINGDEDVLFSVDYMQEIYDRLNCREKKLEILKNASHLILQENTEEVMKRIIPWLEKVL